MKNKKWTIYPLIVSVFILFTVIAAPARGDGGLDVGERVTNFQAVSLNGKELNFGKDILSNTGRTMIFFMTTACSACFEELKVISSFVKDNPGKLNVWAVAVDLRGEKTVKPYEETYKFGIEYIIDPKFILPRLFGLSYTPSFALIDADGVILYKKGGFTAGENVKGIITKYLE